MSCPNCHAEMKIVNDDNQTVLHCGNCGGSFFEENGINRITLATAQKLSEDKMTSEVSGAEKKCPKDQTILKSIPTDSADLTNQPIPPEVTLLQCPKCHGIFAYPDDLLHFKQAQLAKINYFKLWQIPLPSLKTVIIFGAIALFFMTIFANYTFFQKGVSPAAARDLIKKVYFSSFGRYLFLSFQTQIPLRSRIIFFDKTKGVTIEKIVSSQPTKVHSATITNLSLENEITYQIVLTDEKGREIKTEEKRLEINK